MKFLYKISGILLIILLWFPRLQSQSVTVSAGNATSCAGDIVVPLAVNDFTGVSAMSLVLKYDTSVLDYNGYQNFNAELQGGNYQINEVNGRFRLTWFSVSPVTLADGSFIELLFTTNGGTSSLTWDLVTQGACEFSDVDGNVIEAVFIDGLVNAPGMVAQIWSEPPDQMVIDGNNTSIGFSAGGAAAYQWQESTDGGTSWTNITDGGMYSGANWNPLTINGATLDMDGHRYRSILEGGCPPSDTTRAVLLTVKPVPPTITLTAGTQTSCAGEIIVPVTVVDFTGVAAFSLTLTYNPGVLTWNGYQELNGAIDTSTFIINDQAGSIRMTWFSSSPVSISGDTLVELLFTTTGQFSDLNWDTETPGHCEIVDQEGVLINTIYQDGDVYSPGNPPSVYGQPADAVVTEDEAASFTVYASSVYTYRWQVSTDSDTTWTDLSDNTTYSNTGSYQLQINGADLSMNGYQYRCYITGPCEPDAVSQPATLTVNPVPPVIRAVIPTIALCEDTISVPVQVEDFNGVAAISMAVNYDTSKLEYTGLQNINPALSGTLVDNDVNGTIFVGWAAITPVTLGNDILLDLGFIAKSEDNSNLVWNTSKQGNIEFSDPDGNPIQLDLVNGSVNIHFTAGEEVSFTGLDSVYCSNDPVSGLAGTPTGGVFSGPGISGSVFDPSSAGPGVQTIQYIYSNVYGCQYIATGQAMVLAAPEVMLGGPFTACEGDTITLNAGTGYLSYEWSNGGSTDNLLEVTGTGTYHVTVTDSNGCQSISPDVSVMFNTPPAKSVITASGPLEYCEGDSVILSAPSGFAGYEWSAGDTTENITVTGSGSFLVRVMDTGGCTSPWSDTVAVNVYTIPDVPSVTADGALDLCEGDSVVLYASAGADSYMWSTGDTAGAITVHSAGDYFVQAVNGGICFSTASDTITITVQPLPVADFTYSIDSLEVTFTNLSVNADDYSWDFGDSQNSTESSPVHVYASLDTFTVTLVAAGSVCGGDTAVSVIVLSGNTSPMVINPVNDLVLGEGFFSTSVDMGMVFNDPDLDTLTYSAASDNDSVVTVNISGKILTISEAGTGTATITVTADDGNGGTATDVFLFSVVTVVNNPPVITGQLPLSYDEDTPFAIHLADLVITDPDNTPADFVLMVKDSSSYSVLDSTITPDINFYGSLFIPVSVSDGPDTSAAFIVAVTVNPVNDAPEITGQQEINLPEDNVFDIALNFFTISDPDNDTSDFELTVAAGSNYTVTGITITPAAGYSGTLSIPVTVSDGALSGSTFDLLVTLTPQEPVCDISISFSYYTDTVTGEISFIPSNTDYELLWSFGDGDTSGLTSPVHLFDLAGTYQVCLNVFDNVTECYFDTCLMVEAGAPGCAADFSSDADEDDNMHLHFTDASRGAVTAWYWNFGDGNYSTVQHPEHRFERSGNYLVCLYTYDEASGCLSEVCREITAGTFGLLADFTYSTDTGSREIIVTSTSSGDITDYYWTYGDGSFNTGNEGSHTYEEPGIYSVCLHITNEVTGEFTSICKNIEVGSPECGLSANFTYFVEPSANKVNFRDASAGNAHIYFWNFGDGTSSTFPDPVHQFETPGYYLVGLSVRDTISGCNDFHVELVQAGQVDCKSIFSYSVDPATLTVTLENLSAGVIAGHYWTFGDGFTSTGSNPEHQYDAEGLYHVTLTVIDQTGTCLDHSAQAVQVGSVECSADFTVAIDSTTNTAWFNSRSLGHITRYYWIFSDGTISTKKDPVHIFTVPGYHRISLNTFDELSGCMDYHETTLLIGRQDIDCEADFIYQSGETTNTVTFADRSLGKGLIWYWNFGDGGVSTDQNPVYQYAESGYYNVCLTVYSSTGIQNTTCRQVAAGVPAVVNCLANFIYTVIDEELKVNYTDKSFGNPDTWTWEFGDEQSAALQHPSHTFTEAGYYTSHLRIENQTAGCESDAFALVNAGMEGELTAGFGYIYESTITTKAESYPVDYIGVSLGDASKYKWSFGDGTYDSTTTTPNHVYTAPGTYYVCLTVYDEMAGTEYTTCDSVRVPLTTTVPPVYDFSEIQLLCYPNPANDKYFVLFDLSSDSYTEIVLYTISGHKLSQVARDKLSAGSHNLELDASGLANGLYIIRLQSGSGTATQILSVQH